MTMIKTLLIFLLSLSCFGANLLVVTKDHPEYNDYKDGDVIEAFTDEDILYVNAEVICHAGKAEKNTDGLRKTGDHVQKFMEKTCEYRFDRTGVNEVTRTNLETLETDIISNTPNADGERMDVPLYIARRLKHDRHKIFGTKGAEIWYGGHTIKDKTKLDEVWAEIELKTPHKKKDNEDYPFTSKEKKSYLLISTENFTKEKKEEYTIPEYDSVGYVVKKRRTKVDYNTKLGLTEEEKLKAKDKDQELDLKYKTKFKVEDVIEIKDKDLNPPIIDEPDDGVLIE